VIESTNDALIACIKACGGSKVVGPRLWPEKPVDAAQRLLLDCLNEDRPQHLTPEQLVLVLRMARERGFHAGFHHLCETLSYAPTLPIEPSDEAAELQRRYIEAARDMARIAERIERLQMPPPVLRSAA
jgi:hypothetical protein